MESYEIVPYAEEFLPAVREIYSHYVLHSTATFHTGDPSLEEMRAIVTPASPRHYACVLREREEGRVLGYGYLGRFKAREAYDDTSELTLYLAPDMTGKGLGRLVLEHLEAKAREAGFHALLAVITSENTASVSLFERAGYQKCAHYREVGKKFGRLLDVVSYEKILGA